MSSTDRPPSVLVIAILQLVFGGLGLVGDLCAGTMQVIGNPFVGMGNTGAQQGQNQPKPEDFDFDRFVTQRSPTYKPIQFASTGVKIGLSVLMIAGGIGLLRMRFWGRVLTIVYAPASISLKIFEAVYASVVIIPILREFVQTLPLKGPQGPMMSRFIELSVYFGIAWSLLMIAYPATILVFMLLPVTAAAFHAKAVSPDDGRVDDSDEYGQ